MVICFYTLYYVIQANSVLRSDAREQILCDMCSNMNLLLLLLMLKNHISPQRDIINYFAEIGRGAKYADLDFEGIPYKF